MGRLCPENWTHFDLLLKGTNQSQFIKISKIFSNSDNPETLGKGVSVLAKRLPARALKAIRIKAKGMFCLQCSQACTKSGHMGLSSALTGSQVR